MPLDWPIVYYVLLPLAAAALAGGLIGWERWQRRHTGGVRTMALVALGSAIFTVLSIHGFMVFVGPGEILEPGRVAAQVVAGVGFLGAGVIVRRGLNVRGLTAATGIWMAAAVGMAAGAGMYVLAFTGGALTFAVLRFFPRPPQEYEEAG